MKRILAALLCFCLLISLVPVPAFAAEDVYINSQESIFPSDTTVRDLYITEDCPSTVILINVKIEGTLYIEADHAVTVRLQGNSTCASAEIYSRATLVGGTYGSVNIDTAFTTFTDAVADTMRVDREGSLLSLNGQVDVLTLFAENIFAGGSGRADKIVVEESGCTINLRYGDIMNYAQEETYTKEESTSVKADFVINPTVSPANSVINAKVTFSNIPEEFLGDYRIYWYIGDTLSNYEWTFTLKEGATAELTCSAHFFDDMGNVLPVWVRLVHKDSEHEMRFVTKVNVVGYSTEEYEDVSYPYEIHLLRNHNVIIIYGKDDNGEYTKLVNVFLCSTGYWNETELGDFEIGLQMRWGSLMADLYGQYSSQFNYNQLFHSVPYWSKEQNNIEWEEYEKLGDFASSGCVRLATVDAKWIYDHCYTGAPVKVYDIEELPVQKPVQCVILEDYLFRGWDPTDPDEDNPTKAYDPPVLAALNVSHNHPVYSAYIN